MNEVNRAAKLLPFNQSTKVAILVLGMHRSGTSMLAGILDCLGGKGPKTEMVANEVNPKGFFESEPIFRLNDEVLAAAGTSWNDWQSLGEGWLEFPRFNEFRARAVDVLNEEYGEASMIYLKDPRICRLLPLWRHALEEMGYRVVCILTHRHPVDVATSLKARKNIEVEPTLGMMSWLRHILDAEAASRDLPRIFTSYSDLIDDWQRLRDRAEEAFSFTWPVMTRVAQQRVAQFVDPSLRHHQSSAQSFLRDPLVPGIFRETFQILENWVRTNESKEDHVVLDGLRRNFDLSAPLLFSPISELEAATRDVKLLTRKIADAEGQRDWLSSQEEGLRKESSQGRTDMEKAKAQASVDAAKVEALTIRLAAAEDQCDRLSSEQEHLREELDQCRADMEKAKTRAKADEAEIESLTMKLSNAEENAMNLLDEITVGTERLVSRDKNIAKLRQEAAIDRRVKERRAEETIRLSAKVIEAERRENALKAELCNLQRQHILMIDGLHNIYKTSNSWKVSAPLRFIRTLLRARR